MIVKNTAPRNSSSHYGPSCGFAALSGGTKSRFCGNNGLFSSVQSAQVGKFFQKSLKLELLAPQAAKLPVQAAAP
ncbi:MAG: hypothetical protein LBP38_04750, partial [Desulfovibrio sp.]|nr:hypothetical protein [Desulfovibrio sp.]